MAGMTGMTGIGGNPGMTGMTGWRDDRDGKMRWGLFDTEQSIDFSKKFRDFFAVSKKINFMDKMTGMMRDGPG